MILREALDQLKWYPAAPDNPQKALVTSAEARRLFPICEDLLTRSRDKFYRVEGGVCYTGSGKSFKEPIEYLSQPTTLFLSNRQGRKDQGISISLNRPDLPYDDSTFWRKINIFGRLWYDLGQEIDADYTPFLVIYRGFPPDLYRLGNFHPRAGFSYDYLKVASLPEVQLFAGAIQVLQAKRNSQLSALTS